MGQEKYKKIEIPLGDTVEQAVNELLRHKEEGQFVYCEFNGVTLYSDTVTMDTAYKEITGLTKSAFDNLYVR